MSDAKPLTLVDRLKHFEDYQLGAGDEYGAEVLAAAREAIRARDAEIAKLRDVNESVAVCAAHVGEIVQGDGLVNGCYACDLEHANERCDAALAERDEARAEIAKAVRAANLLKSDCGQLEGENERLSSELGQKCEASWDIETGDLIRSSRPCFRLSEARAEIERHNEMHRVREKVWSGMEAERDAALASLRQAEARVRELEGVGRSVLDVFDHPQNDESGYWMRYPDGNVNWYALGPKLRELRQALHRSALAAGKEKE